ncbi:MAG: hypothetical protein WA021_03825 [Minisyncoccia bacterium]
MQSLWRFLSYNNAVPIAITILISGAGATFAATNPEVVYDSSETVVAVDNTYIASKDLSSYSPQLQILNVTEDAETYYVAYRLSTIDIVDHVWQDVVREDVLKVSKGVLGQYGDLGLYATEQFKQIVDRQLAYLREVQNIEKQNISTKVIATAYSGLVGRLLDETTETLPGYVPVVTPPVEVIAPYVPEPPIETPGEVAGVTDPVSPTTTPPVNESPQQPSDTNAPTIQILGENPVRIEVGGSAYTDLGVVVTDNSDSSPTLKKFVDGTLTSGSVTITTEAPKEVRIRYEATDANNNTAITERLVIVYAPTTNPQPQTPASTTPTTTPAESEPTPDPEPEPTTPEPQPEPEPAPATEEPPADPAPETPVEE